jgi:hypothetical protein
MPDFQDIAWAPLTLGLSGIGIALSWLAWKRRDLAAGLRGVGWSLLPIALYLTGLLKLGWDIGSSLGDWAIHLVFSPKVWLGLILAGFSVVCFGASGWLRSRRRPAVESSGDAASVAAPAKPGKQLAPRRKAAPAADPGVDKEFAEIEEILRNRGIT